MDLTPEESDFLDRHLELLWQSRNFLRPNPFATLAICGIRKTPTVYSELPERVLKRIWSAEENLPWDPFGEPESQSFIIRNKRVVMGLDWFPLREILSLQTLNQAEALALSYDDTCRESFEAIVEYYDILKTLPTRPEPYREPPRHWTRPKVESRAAIIWRQLKSYLKKAWKPRKQETPSVQKLAVGIPSEEEVPEPKMDPGPVPLLVIAEHRTDGPNVVAREEGEEFARKIGADFFEISTMKLNWGDCDVLERLAPRMMFQRACGKEQGYMSVGTELRYGFKGSFK
ncbi:hypothetical protein B0J13DRAFT_560243 [Dactylonectria estremocensis]|uniref:Uncharacterized protein n=1 Tax=Dactylonectria estremocensis TaxID=1079267 RepID=A0A9P9J0D1_9HYPO|nr:hypothetical protein B0J13DRAFT_560243 [Dactylonectria estremocensis]